MTLPAAERKTTMFNPTSDAAEIAYRQQRVHEQFIDSQRSVTVAGLRQILGNTLIAMGNNVHGMAAGSCKDAAETRDHIRTVLRYHKEPTPEIGR